MLYACVGSASYGGMAKLGTVKKDYKIKPLHPIPISPPPLPPNSSPYHKTCTLSESSSGMGEESLLFFPEQEIPLLPFVVVREEALCRYLPGGANPWHEGAWSPLSVRSPLCAELCSGALPSPAVPARAALHRCCSAQDLGEMHKVTALKTLQTHCCLPKGSFFLIMETLLMSSAEEITQRTVGEGRLLLACQAELECVQRG